MTTLEPIFDDDRIFALPPGSVGVGYSSQVAKIEAGEVDGIAALRIVEREKREQMWRWQRAGFRGS